MTFFKSISTETPRQLISVNRLTEEISSLDQKWDQTSVRKLSIDFHVCVDERNRKKCSVWILLLITEPNSSFSNYFSGFWCPGKYKYLESRAIGNINTIFMVLTEEQVLGSKTTQTVYLDLSNIYFMNVQCYRITYYGEGNDTPLQYPCLENLMDRGAW